MNFIGIEDRFKKIFISILSVFVRSKPIHDIASLEAKRILVVRQHDQLGDMICISPLLQTLKERFPKPHLTLITSRVNYDIMLHHPYVDEVILYDKLNYGKSPLLFLKFLRSLRKERYDMAIVPVTVSMSVTSDLIALCSGATVRIGAESLGGIRNPAISCLTHPVPLDWKNDPRRHQTLRNLDILKPLEIQQSNLQCLIGLTREEQHIASAFLKPVRQKYKFLVGIHPGAGKPPNRWSAKRFADVANRLSNEYQSGIVITAGPMDNGPLQELLNDLHCPYELVHNQPIRSVAAIIDQLDLYITNDTGVMHIAGAVRTNLLALFGPTDPLQWAPTGPKNRYISAPDGNMNSIRVEEVNAVIDLILNEIKK